MRVSVKSNDVVKAENSFFILFSCNNKPGFNKTDTSSGMSEHIVQKVSTRATVYKIALLHTVANAIFRSKFNSDEI